MRVHLLLNAPIALASLVSSLTAQSITLNVGSASSTPGVTVSIPVSFSSHNGAKPTAFQWTLSFPAASVTSISASAGAETATIGKSLEQDATGEQVERQPARAEHRRGIEDLGTQERLAAGEHDHFRSQRRQRAGEVVDLAETEIPLAGLFPPVAGDAAAVTTARRIEDDEREHERPVGRLS